MHGVCSQRRSAAMEAQAMNMVQRSGSLARRAAAFLAGAALAILPAVCLAQSGAPIRIGYATSQTGALASGANSALLAQKIWEETVNARGGLLGRPVKLVYYDNQ